MPMMMRVVCVFALVNLALSQEVCNSEEGCAATPKDETSLVQKKINVHKKAATADTVSATVYNSQQTVYCRIIGPGGGVGPAADHAAAKLLLENKCTQIDWDGDPLEKPDGTPTGNFAGALAHIVEFGAGLEPPLTITLTPHCTLSDCGAKTDAEGKDITNADGTLVNGYGADQAGAIKVRVDGGEYTAPGVVPVGATAPNQNDDLNAQQPLWAAAEASVKLALPNALEPANPDDNFKKYTTLAVADVQLRESEKNLVIWLVDTDRPLTPDALKPKKTFGDGYWNWVSLAEYLMFPPTAKRTYMYVDSRTGDEVSPQDMETLIDGFKKEAMGVSPPIE